LSDLRVKGFSAFFVFGAILGMGDRPFLFEICREGQLGRGRGRSKAPRGRCPGGPDPGPAALQARPAELLQQVRSGSTGGADPPAPALRKIFYV